MNDSILTASPMRLEDNIIELSKLASEQLRKKNFRHSLYYLNQALFTLKFFPSNSSKDKLRALVYNNLGCYLRKVGKESQAIAYFEKIIELSESSFIEVENLASTYLNLCGILSERGNHEEAISYASKACSLLKVAQNKSNIKTLAIAHHSLGLEYEHLSKHEEALESLNFGLKICSFNFGNNNPLTITIKNCIERVKRKAKNLRSIKDKFLSKLASKRPSIPTDLYHKYILGKSKPKQRNSDENDSVKFKFNYDLPFFNHHKRRSCPEQPRTAFNRRRGSPIIDNIPMIDEETQMFTPQIPFPSQKPNKSYIYSPNLDKSTRADTLRSTWSPKRNNKSRINSQRHHDEEKLAATIIQSWWRGICARRKFNQLKIMIKIKKAELTAKIALNEAACLKKIAAKKFGVWMSGKSIDV
ncbi:unnamed protein product [Blepharisma stoltei]|uniref:Uncharacterized protein n=1 Tax=Blepharisma stoltei TaxID=1481888 RepID=A0AAU9JTX7_9CILI|nr:unnamed protein product [Blepharisma stoltei]